MKRPPVDAERTQLRSELRARRRSIAASDRIAGAQALSEQLLAFRDLPVAGHVAGYWAMDGEIALHAWQMRLPPELTYCLPVLADEGRLGFAPWRAGDPLVTNRFGIPEPDVPRSVLLAPASMALVVLPLVGFDARCERLGMGGGWYDRSFAESRAGPRAKSPATPVLVGAAFELQRVDALPTAPWDVALDAVCTERQTYYRQPMHEHA
jgi:5-formyltetrahydrofolate cyclo-ligase